MMIFVVQRYIQFDLMSNYQEKYKKALKSIEQIIKANKQIKDELDALRMMRQNDVDSFANIQKQQFKKAYDAVLREKNTLSISNQTLELENEKLRYTISELEQQVALYKNDIFQKNHENRETLLSNQQPQPQSSNQPSPRKLDSKDFSAILKQKQAQFHRTIENYEEHHSNLQRNNKRLEERLGELESKLTSTEKNWRIKFESKELEVIDIKALTRQEFTEQITLLRKENSSLKIANNDLTLKLENVEKNIQFNKNLQSYDWEADLVKEMINVKANLEPLRQQISELQEMNVYQKEQSIRQRTNLQTRVLELESEVEKLNETIRGLQKKSLESYQERSGLEEKAHLLKKYEEQNQLLNGKIIVMQSREIALRNRTGEELEERVLQFENRIQLLLNNKQGLRQLRQVGIHQLIALKAYILELDSKLKELLLSNTYLLKKYRSYKEKYQTSLKEHKQYGMTINSLKIKILGYDKLVLKLQGELERMIRASETETVQVNYKTTTTESNQMYKKKYELMKQKLEIQQKYKEQQIQTFKLNYETRIMELTIKVEEFKSLKETIELYRTKNQELQTLLSKKESELYESKVLTNSKVNASENDPMTNTRQSKEIINTLHINLKQNDETIFKLQSEIRTKEDNYKRTIAKLERQLNDLKQDHLRELNKREMDINISMDEEAKKYKIKINELEHNYQLISITHKDEHSKRTEEVEGKIRKLEQRLQEAESKREEEVFARRRLEKQVLDASHDKQQLQRTISELQVKIGQYKVQQREYEQVKAKASSSKGELRESHLDYQLQSKDAIIKRLSGEVFELKGQLGGLGEKEIAISSQKNENYYLRKEIEELNDAINKYNNEITFLKSTLDTNKASFNQEFSNVLQDKENAITRLRKDLSARDNKLHDYEEDFSKFEETIRRLKRDLGEIERLKQEAQRAEEGLAERERIIQQLRANEAAYEEQVERVNRELAFIKESFQELNYELLEKKDEVSKLQLQLNTLALRNSEQAEGRFLEELSERERQYSRLNGEFLALKNTLAMVSEDKNYLQENSQRVNSDLLALRADVGRLQEEVDSLTSQLYYKAQEVSKLQYSLESCREQLEEGALKGEEAYRLRTEIFSLKSDVGNLQEEVYGREAANARLSNELAYLRSQANEQAEELHGKQEQLSKLSYELSALRGTHEYCESALEEKERAALRAVSEAGAARGKFRELEEEMEEREQAFSVLSQELGKVKANLSYYEEEIEEKNLQAAKLSSEKELLKAEIARLTEVIGEKSSELNRSKQEIFAIRLEAGERDYEEKMRIDQEMFSLKNRINLLEHQVEDRDSQIRRLHIEVDAIRSLPAAQPLTSEEEVEELRGELGRRQRELINNRFELEDRQYQLETATNSANMLKTTVAEYQQRLNGEREEYEASLRECAQRERRLQQEVSSLSEQLERRSYNAEAAKVTSFAASYSEEEMGALREQFNLKQRELNSLKYELEDKLFVLENIENKARMQEALLHQIEQQYNEDRDRYEDQLHQGASRERHLQLALTEMEHHYQQQIATLQTKSTLTAGETAGAWGQEEGRQVKQYVEEIDRLNRIIRELEEDIATFKLKLSSMINQENRIEENLVTMVLLFSEVESIRDRIKSKESEISEVRKSFMQMAVSGEIEANKMSRIMGIVQNKNLSSEEQLDADEPDRQPTHIFDIEEAREHLETSRQPNKSQQSSTHQQNHSIQQQNQATTSLHSQIARTIRENEVQEIVSNVAFPADGEPMQREGVHVRTGVNQVRTGVSEVRGSLINQLQKDQESLDGSQARGGQITIKIQNANQYVASSTPQHYAQTKIVPQYVSSPQYVQSQPMRIIQQVPQQLYMTAPYSPQGVLVQGHSGAFPPAFQGQGVRPSNFMSLAAPVGLPYRSLP